MSQEPLFLGVYLQERKKNGGDFANAHLFCSVSRRWSTHRFACTPKSVCTGAYWSDETCMHRNRVLVLSCTVEIKVACASGCACWSQSDWSVMKQWSLLAPKAGFDSWKLNSLTSDICQISWVGSYEEVKIKCSVANFDFPLFYGNYK